MGGEKQAALNYIGINGTDAFADHE